MAMDAKDLRTEAVLGDRSNDGNAKYAQGGATLPCNRTKPYQDIGSNSLAKVDVQAARPCAVIGPDRVVPPAASSDAYLKKGPIEPWLTMDNSYRRPPDYPHKALDYQHPARNISPRQTFQENMQRIMVPPSYNSVKLKEDHNFSVDTNISPMKNNKFNIPPDSKYCEVPYAVSNAMTNEQKTVRNSEISVPTMNPLARGAPHAWPPNSANIRPPKPYGAPELYQYPEYSSCAGPRPMLMPRPHRTVHEDAGHMYPDPYFQEGSIRFKPYPTVKERFTQPRYDYIANYSNPFHPPPPFPTHKYELQKSVHSHPYPGYPQVPIKYLDNRMSEPILNGYQRSNPQAHYGNVPFRNQVIHPTYGPVGGNCLQTNKYYPFAPESSAKPNTSNKLPYDNNNKIFPEGFYVNELARTHPMKGQVLPPNYPGNIYGMPPHTYYRRENPTMKGYEFGPHVRNIDPSMPINGPPLSRFPSQFSPSTIAISPSDSNTSNDTNQTQGASHEDCGYVSQSSSVSMRSMESGTNRMPYDIYRRYDQRYNTVVKSSLIPKYESNSHASSKDKKDIDVRQFLQMWNEGEEENGDNNNLHENGVRMLTNSKDISKVYEANNQEQLYVLGLVNVPSEELGKYEHIQKVSKLPENIKGYNSIELLHQFEEVIESSNLNNYNSKPSTPRTFESSLKGSSTASLHGLGIPTRPISPLDVEAKISQSVIHKEVGCNFEIKPCSPKMLNVEIATPVHSVLGERVIEKVTNPLIVQSSILNNANESILKCQEQRINENVSSCKMINTQFSSSDHNGSVKTNYSLQDLESNSGVCLASLPRLDNDIELSFPEVNQQFINANKVESVITTTAKDLPNLDVDRPVAKDQVLQEIDQCLSKPDIEKDLSKLSKYRKLKRKGSGPKEIFTETNVQALRTDSVIIKNPENLKNQEECLSNSPNTNDAQQDPINLTVTIDNRTIEHNDVQEADSILNKSSDLAIDFSLNSSEHCNTKENLPNFKINTNLRQSEEKDEVYLFNEEVPKSAFHASFPDILPDSKAPEYDSCKPNTIDSVVGHDVFATEQKINNVVEKSENSTSPGNLSKLNAGNKKLHQTEDEFHYNNVTKDNEISVTEDLQTISATSSNKFMLCDKNKNRTENYNFKSKLTQTNSAINQRIKELDNDVCDNKTDLVVNKKSEMQHVKQSNEPALYSKMSTNKGIIDENEEAKEINNIVNVPKDSQEAHISSAHDDFKKSTLISTLMSFKTLCAEQQEFANLVNTPEEVQEVVNLQETPDGIQEIPLASNIPTEPRQVENTIFVPDDLACVSKESPNTENTLSPTTSSEINESAYFNELLGDDIGQTYKSIGTLEKSQGEDKTGRLVRVSEEPRDSNIICDLEKPEDKQELRLQIDCFRSKEIKYSDKNMERKVNCREVTTNKQGTALTHAKYKINKELFSPQIQKLLLLEEGVCLNELQTVSNVDAMIIKETLLIRRRTEVLNSDSSDREISCFDLFDNKSAERSISPKNFDFKAVEDSPVNVSKSVKNTASDSDGDSHCDVNLIISTESNWKDTKDDSNDCKRDGVLNRIDHPKNESVNLDINEETEKHNIPSLGTKLTQTIRTNDSQKVEVAITQSKNNSIESETDTDTTSVINDTSNDDKYAEKPSGAIKNEIYVKVQPCLSSKNITQFEGEPLLHPKDCTVHNVIKVQVPPFSTTNAVDSNESTKYPINRSEETINKNEEIETMKKMNTQYFNTLSSEISIEELNSNSFSSEVIAFDNSLSPAKTDKIIIPGSPKLENVIADREQAPKFNNEENTIQQKSDNDRIDENINEDSNTSNNCVETDYILDFEDSVIPNQSSYDLQGDINEHSSANEIHCVNERLENVNNIQEIATSSCNESKNKIFTDPSQDVTQTTNFEIDQNKKVQYSSNYRYKKKKSLKRSLSESALDDICDNVFEGCDNKPLLWSNKRQKVDDSENLADTHFVPDSYCNLIQQNRRNSVSSMYNEDNVSFCILIENNCIISEEEETEKICFAEIREGCLPCLENSSENIISGIDEVIDETTEEVTFPDDIIFSPSAAPCEHEDKALEETWVDDVAYVETVVSEDVAEDIVISASTSPKNDSDIDEELNDDVDIYGDHTDKVKYIYGDKMCSDDAHLVETLYRTPQMDVNRTLVYRESQAMEECNRYYDKESLEKVLSDSVNEDIVPEIAEETQNLNCTNPSYSTPATSENVHDCSEFHNMDNSSLFHCSRDKFNNSDHSQFVEKKEPEEMPKIPIEQTQDQTIHSCESSVDNVFSYVQREESPKCVISSSPEVSSTTSEDKNSSILLKITNYNGSRISEINNINSGNRISCKYTEDKDYISSHNNLPARPLITKAAQKYIPPLKESIRDLKVQLPLPQHSLLKLKQLKVAKEKPKSIPKTSNTVCRKQILKKPKPKFEDVLKSIDEIQVQKHKDSKKIKKAVPKVVIKKNGNGSHYASTSDLKDKYNPDLTGRKWQPWVFIERNNFIDKMALKKETRAVFNYRKNEYVLAEKFRKYRSVNSAKFVISQPKLNDSISGQLKYTIKLKQI
ncbi:uncharacterized protein LOC113229981 [Hyposmocoma kahamanoa]|uniref:uncharacterized protein LOC113229981 n=1 Tax=Hyposmocoma kahamanoa TaxID=1477025 RepID=UPI000E6D9807|nr:uncharacterized protein LOC113229981 [Hyposmocoma kahamanoa]